VVILDLGCGQHKVPGARGTDIRPLPGVDVVHDLTQGPYPFATSCADEVHLNHVLEHMPDAIRVMEEVWRITKPGGTVHIRVPHYTGPYAWKDPTHVRCFTTESFDYFGANIYSYYTRARFRVAAIRLRYFLHPSYRRVYNWWGAVVQWLLDRHPTFAERFLAYLVGGIDEMEVALVTLKDGAA
jgi:SAM-dependent methyltransferase